MKHIKAFEQTDLEKFFKERNLQKYIVSKHRTTFFLDEILNVVGVDFSLRTIKTYPENKISEYSKLNWVNYLEHIKYSTNDYYEALDYFNRLIAQEKYNL